MIMKMRNMMKRKNGQKGFTLVELIVVMAILAVIAAIAVPRYSTVLSDSKYKAHNANVQTIGKAAQLYFATEAPTADGTIDSLTGGGYLDAVPTNPYGGDAYTCAIDVSEKKATVSPGTAVKAGKVWTPATGTEFNL